jgi:hypothetical protein
MMPAVAVVAIWCGVCLVQEIVDRFFGGAR